jgi:SPX domain protein involved in polyphosphate accumulation
MNINQNISKLLLALKQRGKLYKINSFKYYSENNGKYSTKFQILKRIPIKIYNSDENKYEIEYKYERDYECYGQIGVLEYLAGELKEGSEAEE